MDKFTIWNATISTAKLALEDAVHDLAFSRAEQMLTADELEAEFKMEFIPADRCVKTGKILTYRMLEQEKKRYHQFNGLTFSEQLKKLEAQIMAETPPAIYESFQTD